MAPSTSLVILTLLLSSLSPATAQTWSACNPMNTTVKCADNPALGMSAMFDFSQTNITDTWNATSGSVSHDANGGDFVIKKRFDSPTLQSNFYIFGGVVEVHMKSAQGQGIISSVVLQSDDLDEVDWEWIGGNNTHVETNYFGKGNTTSYDRAIYYPVQSPEDMYHNYTVQWTKDQIVWFVDTVPIRTLHAKDAYGGYNFPQTPMNVRIGIWAGGDESMPQGTIDWAGGKTDYTKAPFAMYVKNVTVTDYSTNASAYHWSDTSGSWDSIKVIAGNSTTKQTLLATPAPTVSQKFAALPTGAKIAIYTSSAAVGAALLSALIWFCIRQRRAGRREQAAYAARLETERREQEAFQMENKNPDSLVGEALTPGEYAAGAATAKGGAATPMPKYTMAGAAGFGSGGYQPVGGVPSPNPSRGGTPAPNPNATRSFSAPLSPPIGGSERMASPAPPAAYGMGGLRSPSAGSGPGGAGGRGYMSPRASPAPPAPVPGQAQSYYGNGFASSQARGQEFGYADSRGQGQGGYFGQQGYSQGGYPQQQQGWGNGGGGNGYGRPGAF